MRVSVKLSNHRDTEITEEELSVSFVSLCLSISCLRHDQRPLAPGQRVAEVFDVGDEDLLAAAA